MRRSRRPSVSPGATNPRRLQPRLQRLLRFVLAGGTQASQFPMASALVSSDEAGNPRDPIPLGGAPPSGVLGATHRRSPRRAGVADSCEFHGRGASGSGSTEHQPDAKGHTEGGAPDVDVARLGRKRFGDPAVLGGVLNVATQVVELALVVLTHEDRAYRFRVHPGGVEDSLKFVGNARASF